MSDGKKSLQQENRMSGIRFRIISGLVLAPVVILAVAASRWTFMALVMLAAGLALYEWYGLVKNGRAPYRDMAAGAAYILLSFVSCVFLRLGFDQGAWLALCVLLSVWAGDTGAYVVGKKLGRHKMAPRISPNKTLEGLGGAMFFSGLALMILAGLGRFIDPLLSTDVGLKPGHVWLVFFAGCFLGLVGQAGDLLISVFKRRAGVKDSGKLIPGHGGLLDRIDSLMLAAPVFFLMVALWMM